MEQRYEINDKTMALYAMTNKTRVYEEDKSFIVDMPATKIMEESCSYFGSSLEGRKKGTENLIGITYKPPIIVEETHEVIFFPTSSPKMKTCSWLRSDQINRFYYKNNRLIVEFKNGTKIPLNISYEVMNNQILKSTRLESVLRGRKMNK